MATETFYKRIVLSNEAAERLADGLDKPRPPFRRCEERIADNRRRSAEWIKKYLSQSEK